MDIEAVSPRGQPQHNIIIYVVLAVLAVWNIVLTVFVFSNGNGSNGNGEDAGSHKESSLEGIFKVDGKDVILDGYNLVIKSTDKKESEGNLVVGLGHSYSQATNSFVAGLQNTVEGDHASILGGTKNQAKGKYPSVSGGWDNEATGEGAVITGGRWGTAAGDFSVITGGSFNNITKDGYMGIINGGAWNRVEYRFAGVVTGHYNVANAPDAHVIGGYSNRAVGQYTTVLGGAHNSAIADGTTILGGLENTASGRSAVIVGGAFNKAEGVYSVVSGHNNTATGFFGRYAPENGNGPDDSCVEDVLPFFYIPDFYQLDCENKTAAEGQLQSLSSKEQEELLLTGKVAPGRLGTSLLRF